MFKITATFESTTILYLAHKTVIFFFPQDPFIIF